MYIYVIRIDRNVLLSSFISIYKTHVPLCYSPYKVFIKIYLQRNLPKYYTEKITLDTYYKNMTYSQALLPLLP